VIQFLQWGKASQHTWKHLKKKSLLLLFLLLTLLFFLFFLFFGSLDNSRGDTVQISLTVLADPPAAIFRLLQHPNLLQRLADFSLNGS